MAITTRIKEGIFPANVERLRERAMSQKIWLTNIIKDYAIGTHYF
jgi:hypothetical protein